MTRTNLVAGAVALAVAGAVYAGWGRTAEPGPEEQLRRHVVELSRSAEARKPGEMLERVSLRFTAPEVGDKDALRGFLAAQLLRGEWVRAWPMDIQAELREGARAHQHVKMVLGRSTASRVEELGRDASLAAWRLELDWVREEDGEWRIVSARWDPIPPAELLTP